MLISILVITMGIILCIALESFLSTLFSFSVIIIVALILVEKWDTSKWIVVISLSSIFVDVILHRCLGITLLSISLSILVLNILFLVMPKKQLILSYIPYFFALLLFYIIIQIFSPLLLDGILGYFSLEIFIQSVIKSLVSTLLIFLINILTDRIRTEKIISI
ncbi:hypothetical protein K8R14_03025 [bacterium]|nr:hypothetical protein [bacterium]